MDQFSRAHHRSTLNEIMTRSVEDAQPNKTVKNLVCQERQRPSLLAYGFTSGRKNVWQA